MEAVVRGILEGQFPNYIWRVDHNQEAGFFHILIARNHQGADYSGEIDIPTTMFRHRDFTPSEVLLSYGQQMCEWLEKHIEEKTSPKTDPGIELHESAL